MTLTRVQSISTTAASGGALGIHLVTFGCQMNKYDSLLVEGRFVQAGHRIVSEMDEADVVLFNTCSVRDHAEERVWSWLGELKRTRASRPDLVVGVLGCMAQRVGEDVFTRSGHVDIVCGTRKIADLPGMVDQVLEGRRLGGAGTAPSRLLDVETDTTVSVERAGEEYRGGLCGHLAVMRGCDLNCTFCIVPSVRGRVQSRSITALVDEARWMVDGGARVITLLGQTVNSYGEDLPRPEDGAAWMLGRQGRPGLADLIRELQEIDGLARIRLITLHPSYVTQALAEAIRDCDKMDRFLPLPAQSGSDDVLRRMRRGYTTDLYRKRVDLLRATVPDIELGTDWIVGFPGESEADFEATLAFAEEIGFAQGYVFKFDPRPGTPAHGVEDDIPTAVKKERNQRLLATVERVALARMGGWIGQTTSAFLEDTSARREGILRGRTLHGLPIQVPGDRSLVGTTARLEVQEATAFGLSAAFSASS